MNNNIIKADQEEIKKKITILPDLKNLIPPLKDEEIKRLEENILTQGCREALVIWKSPDEQFILVDGHNRYDICVKLGIDFNINLMGFDNKDTVIDFMINNQLGRRNLTPENASYLRGLKYEREKIKFNNINNLKQFQSESPKFDNLEKEKTAERIAKQFNVSKNTILRDAAYSKGLEKIGQTNPALKTDILKGKNKARKQDIEVIGRNEVSNKILQDVSQAKDIRKLASELVPEKPLSPLTVNQCAKYSIKACRNKKRLEKFIKGIEGKKNSSRVYLEFIIYASIVDLEQEIKGSEEPAEIINKKKEEIEWLHKQLNK
ncbi:ParB N-terminal domain-containing protein [Xanthovirga aplysinae]|uniref:ParB N-terminal domain-containing protein n=1 Tax=Xanthovirga aplysinae TaxID=2529853 RepID=UPI0012BD42E0|nr:ParB N-terminal domain-containing protein [Xanthovirga aplysinae]MTI30661.1 hypothetical protein [Xanthovirga aplysinae]